MESCFGRFVQAQNILFDGFSLFSSKSTEKQNSCNEDSEIPTSPGPGNYDILRQTEIACRNDPKYSIPRSGKLDSPQLIPGPGAYDSKTILVFEGKPKYTFGSRIVDRSEPIAIGPGSYDSSLFVNKTKTPAYSLQGRVSQSIASSPGPGDYEAAAKKRILSVQFAKSSRNGEPVENIPGPGAYDLASSRFQSGSVQEPSYHFGLKPQEKTVGNIPGPGQYDLLKQLSLSKIGGIISRDLRDSNIYGSTPGPGRYNTPQLVRHNPPSWTVSKSKREMASESFQVGPGSYDQKAIMVRAPSCSFGHESRLKAENQVLPGPGAYEGFVRSKSIAVTIGSRLKEQTKASLPGPGDYDATRLYQLQWHNGKAKYSIGRSNRDSLGGGESPGPGSYDSEPRSWRKGRISFMKDPREKGTKQVLPGPGQYTLKSDFADVPNYLLAKK